MIIDTFDTDKEIFIIAEIGNNHEGKYALAEEMTGLAAKAGADAVKFQTIIPEQLVSVQEKDRIQQLKKFQLSYKEFEGLAKIAKEEGVLFLSTPFAIETVSFLEPLVPAFKISSGDIDFYPLIERIAGTGKPIIFSSGSADMEQIKMTKTFIEKIWQEKGIRQELAILHCVSSYPTALADANLSAIKEIQKFGVTVGYSDHTLGIEAAVLSVALGARIIEKHFTLNKNHSGFHDHQLSADPGDFAQMVRQGKETIAMLGDGDISRNGNNGESAKKIRRSIAAKHNFEKGAVISLNDIAWVRPGGGVKPGSEKSILGKALNKPIIQGQMITLEDVN